VFNLWEEVDELDVRGQQETAGGRGTQVVLGVQQLELHQRAETMANSGNVNCL